MFGNQDCSMLLSLTIFRNHIYTLVLATAVVLLFSSCEPAFAPIEQNNRTFTVFGYLNASADTQFVRLEYLRDSMATDTPTQLDAEVTLTNVETGQTATLQDSLFSYYQSGRAHNYYTTMDISPNQSYEFQIQGHGASSSAEVTIPSRFPKPNLFRPGGYVEVRDIGRLIAVKTLYHTCQNCGGLGGCPTEPFINTDSFLHLQDTVHLEENLIKAGYHPEKDLSTIGEGYPRGKTFTVVRSEVIVAAGTPQWPDFLTIDEEAAALPHVASNIEGGVGLLGGIVTDTLTIETNSPEPCYSS